MDNEPLRLIARLKIMAARAGLPVDVVRFAADRPYARSVLQKFSDSASEEDVLLALLLMEKLRVLAPVPPEVAAPPSQPVQIPPVQGEDKPAVEERYVGRLR